MRLVLLALVTAAAAAAAAKPPATPEPDTRRWAAADRAIARNRVRDMFTHAYDRYIAHAFPADELRPLTCDGVDTWGGFALTQIEALDTLAIMGNHSEFARAVQRVVATVSFDRDENTSVFETNIRALGGLLSAHMIAADPDLPFAVPGYRDELLALAHDLGDRLLKAFDTPTGMPYGTVNLRHGVPPGETTVTSTAGVSTFLLEFGALSDLTGDERYRTAALRAVETVWSLRSSLNLLGTHVDVAQGTWTDPASSTGGGSDSFYEYLLKAWLVDGDDRLMDIFEPAFRAVEQRLVFSLWHLDVDMETGDLLNTNFESLKMFWPGLRVLYGDVDQAAFNLGGYTHILRLYPFPPERINLQTRQPVPQHPGYVLRPEVIESIFYVNSALNHNFWLSRAWDLLIALDKHTRVPCGFACVADVTTLELRNRMESFFLAETLKYFYLIFDDGTSLYHRGSYVFTTEAHLIPMDPRKRGRTRSAGTPRRGPGGARAPRRWVGWCPAPAPPIEHTMCFELVARLAPA